MPAPGKGKITRPGALLDNGVKRHFGVGLSLGDDESSQNKLVEIGSGKLIGDKGFRIGFFWQPKEVKLHLR